MTFKQGNVRLVSLTLLLFALATAPCPAVAGGRDSKQSKTKADTRKPADKTPNKAQPGARDKRTINAKTTAASKADNKSRTVIDSSQKSSRKVDRSAQLALVKRERAAELKRAEKRRVEAARLAAVAREHDRDEELRVQVQSMIAKDDLSGEDPEIRRAAIEALGDHAGTVVVMNPQTGRVYSIVNQQWALREGFKPCSTIKLVTGLAGLNENVIDPNDTTKISDTNQVSLTKALAYSKNGYFQQVGEQVGFDKMLSYARRLGLGEKTGINARGESQGRLPGAKAETAIHRMSSHGDHFEVTALQLATLVSAIGNGGKLLTPYIVRTRQDESKFKTKVRRNIKIDEGILQQIVPGMAGAVKYGSGRRAYDSEQTIAGKTGTCIEQGGWVGLFTSYAPLENPRLAVVVIARGADGRSHLPAAVAGRIYRGLNGRFESPARLQVAATRKPSASNREEFEADDEEERSAVEYSYEPNGARRTQLAHPLAGNGRAAASVKPVLMQIPQQTAKPAESLPTPGDGSTRPRRVTGT